MKGVGIGILLYMTAQTLAYFQTNGLVIYKWFEENVILTSIILGPIVGVLFAYGTKYIYQDTEALWVARFLGFASGYMIFIPLTWWFMGESPFTLKNMLSFALCSALVAIQFFMK